MFMSDFTKPGSSLARIATHTRDRIGSIPIDSLRVFDNAPYPRLAQKNLYKRNKWTIFTVSRDNLSFEF